jgi:hypothetical protein
MFARLTLLQGSPDRADEGIRLIQETILPGAKQQAGFQGGYWGLDRATGKAMALTLWGSEQAMNDSGAFAQQSRDEAATDFAGQILSVELYEVVAHA